MNPDANAYTCSVGVLSRYSGAVGKDVCKSDEPSAVIKILRVARHECDSLPGRRGRPIPLSVLPSLRRGNVCRCRITDTEARRKLCGTFRSITPKKVCIPGNSRLCRPLHQSDSVVSSSPAHSASGMTIFGSSAGFSAGAYATTRLMENPFSEKFRSYSVTMFSSFHGLACRS